MRYMSLFLVALCLFAPLHVSANINFKYQDGYIYVRNLDSKECLRWVNNVDAAKFFPAEWSDYSEIVTQYGWESRDANSNECVDYVVSPNWRGDTRPVYDVAKLLEGITEQLDGIRVLVGANCGAFVVQRYWSKYHVVTVGGVRGAAVCETK